MKTRLFLAVALAGAMTTALILGPAAKADSHKADEHQDGHKEHAKDDHKDHHDHDAMAGPNGGKVLHEVDPHVELFVTKDRKIQITILDEDGKAAAPGDQDISVMCGDRSAPTRMQFEKGETAFLSDKALPAGINIPSVVRIKMKSGDKPQTIRLNLNLEQCPTCDYKEYACVCDHSEEGDDNAHAHEKEKK